MIRRRSSLMHGYRWVDLLGLLAMSARPWVFAWSRLAIATSDSLVEATVMVCGRARATAFG